MPYFLAIDAGGTRTRCLLADEHHTLAHASTGSIKLQRAGEAEATSRLASMLEQVSIAANVPLGQIARTCIGLAGISIPAIRAWADHALSSRLSGELLLVGDEEIALEAAFPGAPGVLLIAGTGSHAIARSADGSLHRAGGWGPILSDEGGGYWIGLEALRAALRTSDSHPDNREACALLHAIQLHWAVASFPDLIELGNRRGDATDPPADFASLAPIVARSAEAGNSLAAEVLHNAGELLAHLVAAVAMKAAASHHTTTQTASDKQNVTLAFTGSVLEHIPAVRTALIAALSRTVPRAQLSEAAVDSLQGALYRARNG